MAYSAQTEREPGFWRHYSPHHEFSLSSVTSLVLHGVIVSLLFFGGLLTLKLGAADRDRPVAVDTVWVEKPSGEEGGGGGPGPEPITPPANVELEPPAIKPPIPVVPLSPPKPKPFQIDPNILKNPEGERQVPKGTEVFADLDAAAKEALANIDRERERQRQSGRENGFGPSGTAASDGTSGPGGNGRKPTIKDIRRHRWQLILDTANPDDYRRQLAALGAVVVISQPQDEYLVFRDLRHPETGKIESLGRMPEFFWVDQNPASVHNLAVALGLRENPPYFVAFLPKTFEDELLDREMKGFHGPEDKIKRTVFKLQWRGSRCEPVVIRQDLK